MLSVTEILDIFNERQLRNHLLSYNLQERMSHGGVDVGNETLPEQLIN